MTRFKAGNRPSKPFTSRRRPPPKLPKAFRPRKLGVFDPVEVFWLASRGVDLEDLLVACGLGRQHSEREAVAAVVASGHIAFGETLARKLAKVAHTGSPRVLSSEASHWLRRYRSEPDLSAPTEAVTVEQILELVRQLKRRERENLAYEATLEAKR